MINYHMIFYSLMVVIFNLSLTRSSFSQNSHRFRFVKALKQPPHELYFFLNSSRGNFAAQSFFFLVLRGAFFSYQRPPRWQTWILLNLFFLIRYEHKKRTFDLECFIYEWKWISKARFAHIVCIVCRRRIV
jgi:hypothetical protein